VPLFDAASPTRQAAAPGDLAELNDHLLAERGPRIVAAVRAIAAGDGPVLVHCTAGKDRTGLVIALVLDAIGVAREAVIADYAASERHLAGEWADAMLERIAARFPVIVGDTADIVAIVTTSPAPLMRGVLERVDAEHGGAAGYLLAHGLTEDELAALIIRLTEPGTDPAAPAAA
jgi:protein-tyrosine phosphatase